MHSASSRGPSRNSVRNFRSYAAAAILCALAFATVQIPPAARAQSGAGCLVTIHNESSSELAVEFKLDPGGVYYKNVKPGATLSHTYRSNYRGISFQVWPKYESLGFVKFNWVGGPGNACSWTSQRCAICPSSPKILPNVPKNGDVTVR